MSRGRPIGPPCRASNDDAGSGSRSVHAPPPGGTWIVSANRSRRASRAFRRCRPSRPSCSTTASGRSGSGTSPPRPGGAIEDHLRLLMAWNAAINLTAIRDPVEAARRHVLDSLAAVPPCATAASTRSSTSVAAAAIPGLPLAAAVPARRALLVDSVGKKARFLATAAAATGLGSSVEAFAGRAETLAADRGIASAGRRSSPGPSARWPSWPSSASRSLAPRRGPRRLEARRPSTPSSRRPGRRSPRSAGRHRSSSRRSTGPASTLVGSSIVAKAGPTPAAYPRDPRPRRPADPPATRRERPRNGPASRRELRTLPCGSPSSRTSTPISWRSTRCSPRSARSTPSGTSATSSATGPSRTASWSGCASSARSASAATTTRRPSAAARSTVQPRCAARPWSGPASGSPADAGLARGPARAPRRGRLHPRPRQPARPDLGVHHRRAPVARPNLAVLTTPYGLYGHTHLPSASATRTAARAVLEPPDGDRPTLDDRRALLNPGSVGQPRDGDPRRRLRVLDRDRRTVTWHRVAYDIARGPDARCAAPPARRLTSGSTMALIGACGGGAVIGGRRPSRVASRATSASGSSGRTRRTSAGPDRASSPPRRPPAARRPGRAR